MAVISTKTSSRCQKVVGDQQPNNTATTQLSLSMTRKLAMTHNLNLATRKRTEEGKGRMRNSRIGRQVSFSAWCKEVTPPTSSLIKVVIPSVFRTLASKQMWWVQALQSNPMYASSKKHNQLGSHAARLEPTTKTPKYLWMILTTPFRPTTNSATRRAPTAKICTRRLTIRIR